MSVSIGRVVVSTVAVALNTTSGGGERLTITNTTANAADLGPSNVTAGNGYPLAANATVTVELDPGDVLYAIRTSGVDTTVAVLRT